MNRKRMVASILIISCQTAGELVLYMNSLSNKYTITKYLTFPLIRYYYISPTFLFVWVIGCLDHDTRAATKIRIFMTKYKAKIKFLQEEVATSEKEKSFVGTHSPQKIFSKMEELVNMKKTLVLQQ